MLDSLQIITFDFIDGQKREHFAIPVEQVKEIRKSRKNTLGWFNNKLFFSDGILLACRGCPLMTRQNQ
jgi:hypothetical protein